MAFTPFKFGMNIVVEGWRAAVSSLGAVQGSVEKFNKSIAATAGMREAATNLTMIGAGLAAIGGAGVYALKGTVDEAAGLDAQMRHLSTALNAGAAGQREYAQASKFAEENSVKFNVAQTDIVDNLYRSMSFIGDWNAALATTSASLAVAKGNMGDAKTVGEQLAIVFNDFGDKTKAAAPQIQHFADVMAYATRHGAFHDVNQLNAALTASIGSAKAAGMGYEDLVATIAAFSKAGLQGSEAGTAIMESLQSFARGKLQKDLGVALATFKNGSLDVIGTFVNLRKEVGSGVISVAQFQAASKALGIRGERALAINVDDLVKFQQVMHDPAITGGAAMQGATTVLAGYSEQMGQLGQKWDVFKDKIGEALIPLVEKFGIGLGKVVDWMNKFANDHPVIFKYITTFTSITAGVVLLGGALAITSGALLGFASFLPALNAFATATGLAAVATRGLAAAQWLFNAAVSANPYVIAIGAIAALAVGTYELYEHWDKVKAFVTKMIPEAFDWGINLLKTFGKGIESAALWPIHALENVLKKMRAYLPFSPAKEGPLRDLHRVRLVETIAESIRPSPLVAAMHRAGMAAMVAAPLMFGAGAGTANAGGSPIVINVSYAPVIGAGSASEFTIEARRHARELAQIIGAEIERRDRRSFSG